METKTIILDDLANETRKSLGLAPGDAGLFQAMLAFMKSLSQKTTIAEISPYLEDQNHPLCVWLLKWSFIYCLREKYVVALDESGKYSPEYAAWVEAFGRILVTIARMTRDYDLWIQHVLNLEDFLCLELQNTDGGKHVICELYDLRGIDFFLSFFLQGRVTAISDPALFENSRIVPRCLSFAGRDEEAALVSREIEHRETHLKAIVTEYSPPSALSLPATLECLRLAAERFWLDYLTSTVWAQT